MDKRKIKANKRIYKDIQFASGLELFCYMQLEKSGLKFGYESEKFQISESRGYNFEFWKRTKKKGFHKKKSSIVSMIIHTPDFIIYNEYGDIVYIIETKGFSNDKFQIYLKLFFLYASKNLLNLKGYYLPSNQKEVFNVITMIKRLS